MSGGRKQEEKRNFECTYICRPQKLNLKVKIDPWTVTNFSPGWLLISVPAIEMPAVRLSSCFCRVDNEASRIVFQLISQLTSWQRMTEGWGIGGNGMQRYQSRTISSCVVKQAAATTQVKADIRLSICSALSCIHLLPPHCCSSLNEEVFDCMHICCKTLT